MAIVVDQASLGTNLADPGSTTIAFTTTANVASGGFVVVGAGGFGGGGTMTGVSGGGLTWTVDFSPATSDIGIASAQAPSGLASGATITATFSASIGARIIGGTSFTGVKTSSPVDGTPLGLTTAGGPGWSTGNYAIQAGSVIVANCFSINSGATQTATAPSVEAWESISVPDDYGRVLVYRIESSAGSYAVAGTWGGGGGNNFNIAVAYLAGATTPDTGLAWIRA